jgi:hypothetical protein
VIFLESCDSSIVEWLSTFRTQLKSPKHVVMQRNFSKFWTNLFDRTILITSILKWKIKCLSSTVQTSHLKKQRLKISVKKAKKSKLYQALWFLTKMIFRKWSSINLIPFINHEQHHLQTINNTRRSSRSKQHTCTVISKNKLWAWTVNKFGKLYL